MGRLQQREKRVLLAGIVFLVGVLIFQFCLIPYMDARTRLAASVKRKEAELVDIRLLMQEYLDLKDRQGDLRKRLRKRAAGFSLFSFLEEQAAIVKVKDHITSMKPSTSEMKEGFSESIVEMKIEKVTLQQLIDFLLRIESDSMLVMVQRLTIQKNSRENGLLDTVVRIKTFKTVRG